MLEYDVACSYFWGRLYANCTRSFEALLRSRFEFIGVRWWNSRQASVVCCSTRRQFEGFCERAENALMPYARSKPRCFPSFHAYDSAKFCAKLRAGIPWSSSFCLPLHHDSIFND